MNNIILTGVDGSEPAMKAAAIAASLAADLNCELVVISASDSSRVELPRLGRLTSETTGREEMAAHQRAIDAHERTAQQTAETAVKTLRQQFPDLSITAKGIDKAPADAILEEAEALDARFVVVGNKHVQGASRILGSVATTVARYIKTDLYIAHTR